MSIADNLAKVSGRIQKATEQASRPPDSVQLLAVSKTRTAAELREAVAAGQFAFGENYLQEALEKMQALSDVAGVEWHFIGPVQSNKTRQIAENFQWIHSVDRLRIAQRLDSQRPPDMPRLAVCIQVNLDDEATKAGIPLEQVTELAGQIIALPRLHLRGLMAIPDPAQPVENLRKRFADLQEHLRTLQDRWPDLAEAGLDCLSMGMSADLEAAIAEGSTIVRVGTALFGARPPANQP